MIKSNISTSTHKKYMKQLLEAQTNFKGINSVFFFSLKYFSGYIFSTLPVGALLIIANFN